MVASDWEVLHPPEPHGIITTVISWHCTFDVPLCAVSGYKDSQLCCFPGEP
jgi:hypothetical protein